MSFKYTIIRNKCILIMVPIHFFKIYSSNILLCSEGLQTYQLRILGNYTIFNLCPLWVIRTCTCPNHLRIPFLIYVICGRKSNHTPYVAHYFLQVAGEYGGVQSLPLLIYIIALICNIYHTSIVTQLKCQS